MPMHRLAIVLRGPGNQAGAGGAIEEILGRFLDVRRKAAARWRVAVGQQRRAGQPGDGHRIATSAFVVRPTAVGALHLRQVVEPRAHRLERGWGDVFGEHFFAKRRRSN